MIEVLKQALEALEQWNTPLYKRGNVINSLRQAIEQAEKQEPVACGTYQEVTDTMNALWAGTLEQVQIAEEMKNKKLYTAPPQRTWVGLTDEEIAALKHNGERYISSQDFARAIEAKLKEKNGFTEGENT